MAGKKTPITQPKFDRRIYTLSYPLQGGMAPNQGTLKRGFMIWEAPLTGYNSLAKMHFLYNPSTVEADYPLSDSTVQAALQFPNAGDKADLRVPLYQTATWSILFDRTYELWGAYEPDGKSRHSVGADGNNPQVVGVLADIIQMQQFTGMMVGFSQGTGGPLPNSGGGYANFAGHQGIMQIVPSYVYFTSIPSSKANLVYYGYVSEWSVQVTHWTSFMVPMRCVINITFTMLPPIQNAPNPSSADQNYVTSLFRYHSTTPPAASTVSQTRPGGF